MEYREQLKIIKSHKWNEETGSREERPRKNNKKESRV